MTAPEKILELVERFDANLSAYKKGQYNETQLLEEKSHLQNNVAVADHRIIRLVYELYDHTEEEICIIEETLK